MVRSFPKVSFWHYQNVFGIMDRTAGTVEALFCVQATREMHMDSDHCWLVSLIVFINYEVNFCILEDLSVEELETLPAGSRPSHHWLPGQERHRMRKCLKTVNKKGEKVPLSDKNWNRFKGNIGETSERCGMEKGFFPEHKWIKLSVLLNKNWWKGD